MVVLASLSGLSRHFIRSAISPHNGDPFLNKKGGDMPALIASQISHQLETGEWLFRSINLSLNHRITGLTGKNGSGKSVLLSILTGDCLP